MRLAPEKNASRTPEAANPAIGCEGCSCTAGGPGNRGRTVPWMHRPPDSRGVMLSTPGGPGVTGCHIASGWFSAYLVSSSRILVRESDVTISISRPGSMMLTTTEPVPLTSTLVPPTRPE